MDIKDEKFSSDLRQKVFAVKHNIHEQTVQIRKTVENAISMTKT
jgi:hypothetical protein